MKTLDTNTINLIAEATDCNRPHWSYLVPS